MLSFVVSMGVKISMELIGKDDVHIVEFYPGCSNVGASSVYRCHMYFYF